MPRSTTPGCACTCRCRARRPATRRSTSTTRTSASAARCCRACCRSRRSPRSSRARRCEIEVFGFGSLCVMVEGRCALSSYATGESPNTHGVCSPAKAVRWQPTPQGLEVAAERRADRPLRATDEHAGYPTLCKGRFDGQRRHLLRVRGADEPQHARDPPAAAAHGHRRGQDRGPPAQPRLRRAASTNVWREAIDAAGADPARFRCGRRGRTRWRGCPKGRQRTLGAYHRPWK